MVKDREYFLNLSKKIYLELDNSLLDCLSSYCQDIDEDLNSLMSFDTDNTSIFYCNPNLKLSLSSDFFEEKPENFNLLQNLVENYAFSNINPQQKEKISD